MTTWSPVYNKWRTGDVIIVGLPGVILNIDDVV